MTKKKKLQHCVLPVVARTYVLTAPLTKKQLACACPSRACLRYLSGMYRYFHIPFTAKNIGAEQDTLMTKNKYYLVQQHVFTCGCEDVSYDMYLLTAPLTKK